MLNSFDHKIFIYNSILRPIHSPQKMIDTIIPNDPNSHPKAVVIMFGWLGSKSRQVRKYADLYVKRDCAVVTCNAPISAILRYTDPMRVQISECVEEAARILRAAENNIARNGEDKAIVPVVLHYFSNGGTYLAQELDQMIKEAKSNRLDCTLANAEELLFISERLFNKGYEVLDSAPAYINVSSGYNALKASVSNTTVRLIATAIVYTKFMVLRFIAWLLGMVTETDEFWNKMITSELCLRQAFIFSDTDTVTDPQKLEELIEMRIERGIDVRICKFQGSVHVLHIKMYPEKYAAICAEVIETVTSSVDDDTDVDSVLVSEDEDWWH